MIRPRGFCSGRRARSFICGQRANADARRHAAERAVRPLEVKVDEMAERLFQAEADHREMLKRVKALNRRLSTIMKRLPAKRKVKP